MVVSLTELRPFTCAADAATAEARSIRITAVVAVFISGDVMDNVGNDYFVMTICHSPPPIWLISVTEQPIALTTFGTSSVAEGQSTIRSSRPRSNFRTSPSTAYFG